jgi:hypothetical protein
MVMSPIASVHPEIVHFEPLPAKLIIAFEYIKIECNSGGHSVQFYGHCIKNDIAKTDLSCVELLRRSFYSLRIDGDVQVSAN